MVRTRLLLGLLFVLLVPLVGCQSRRGRGGFDGKPGPHVLTSFAPIYCLAASVAGEDATVDCLIVEKGPHSYEFSPRDAIKLHGATLFFINGLGLDDGLAKKMIDGSGNSQVKLVALGERLPRDLLHPMGPNHDQDEHGEYDPHVWLGIPQAIAMVVVVRDGLKQADPDHAAGYDQRAAAMVARLQAIQDVGQAKLKDKTERRLISFHDSLGYFAPTFGLQIVASIETRPGVEPGGQWMKHLIQLCKEQKVRVIATEPQYSSSNGARTILAELRRSDPSAAFVEINPAETAPPNDLTPDYLERIMKQNVDRLVATLR